MHTWRKVPSRAKTPIALTIGNFDGVHLGHQAILSRLKDTASRLGLPACVMTFEPHPREFFAPDQAPVRLSSLREKLTCLIQTEVDCIHICRFNYDFARIGSEQFIADILNKELAVRWLLIGDDFRFGARRAGDFAMLQSAGLQSNFTVESMGSVTVDGERASSSGVRKALAAGDMEQAANLLGRPYVIDGSVRHGDKIGRQLGFHTANIRIKHNPLPMSGVFAVEVAGLGDKPLPGVANLGIRPTLGGTRPLLEVHLFDFVRDIYGAHLSVRFVHKLRNEQRFPNLDALKAQIAADAMAARAFFKL